MGSRVQPEQAINQETLASTPRAGATAVFTEKEPPLPRWCAVTNSQGHGRGADAV